MESVSGALKPCHEDLARFTLENGAYDENRCVLIDAASPPLRTITLAQAREMVDRLARGLHAYGLRHGDTVCVVHMNDIMYPVVFLAIVKAGGRFTGANPSYTCAELRHHFLVSETKYIFSDAARLPTVTEASNGLVFDCNIVLWDAEKAPASRGFHTLDAIMHTHLDAGVKTEMPLRFDDEHLSRHTTAALMSTSGTTGLPKMAARSHHNWVMENLAIQEDIEKPYEIRRLLFVPFFHGFAAPLALVDALRSGHQTYIMDRFDLVNCLTYIKQYNITETAMPPPVLVKLMQLPPEGRKCLRSIRLVWSGGAPMTAETQNAALQLFHPEARIVQVYGMTEGGWMTTFKHPERDTTGSIGRLLPGYGAMIRNECNKPIDPTAPGVLYIRSAINMQCYLNNTQATKDTLSNDNWLRTGDVAFFRDGKLYITDREKDIIKVRGWQVSPTELESRLLSHLAVADAAVVGFFPPTSDSEVPVAFVVSRAGVPKTAKEGKEIEEMLKKHLYAHLARYKVNDLKIRWIDKIPKSISGKILRRELKYEEEDIKTDEHDKIEEVVGKLDLEADEVEEVVGSVGELGLEDDKKIDAWNR